MQRNLSAWVFIGNQANARIAVEQVRRPLGVAADSWSEKTRASPGSPETERSISSGMTEGWNRISRTARTMEQTRSVIRFLATFGNSVGMS